LFDIEGPVAFLTFNRPEARNAMTWGMYDALAAACDHVDADANLRVFVLRGAGNAFVAGTDISQFSRFTTKEDAIQYERRLDAIIDRLERVKVPTIAQVNGVAAGGGCMIALACDLRVCTSASRFGVPVARTLGNCLSAANYARLIDLMGPAKTKEMLFTGDLITPMDAASLGLVTWMADEEDLDSTVRRVAADIAGNAPLTIRATKEAVRRIQEGRRPNQTAIDDLIAMCYGSEDFKEGVSSFLAKRKPQFKGK